jgi:hypothetical protein
MHPLATLVKTLHSQRPVPRPRSRPGLPRVFNQASSFSAFRRMVTSQPRKRHACVNAIKTQHSLTFTRSRTRVRITVKFNSASSSIRVCSVEIPPRQNATSAVAGSHASGMHARARRSCAPKLGVKSSRMMIPKALNSNQRTRSRVDS